MWFYIRFECHFWVIILYIFLLTFDQCMCVCMCVRDLVCTLWGVVRVLLYLLIFQTLNSWASFRGKGSVKHFFLKVLFDRVIQPVGWLMSGLRGVYMTHCHALPLWCLTTLSGTWAGDTPTEITTAAQGRRVEHSAIYSWNQCCCKVCTRGWKCLSPWRIPCCRARLDHTLSSTGVSPPVELSLWQEV